MKNLIRLFLVLLIASVGIGLHTSCSEDSDCSIAGRAMINCTLYTKDVKDEIVNDTLDSLTVTALGTDSFPTMHIKKIGHCVIPSISNNTMCPTLSQWSVDIA